MLLTKEHRTLCLPDLGHSFIRIQAPANNLTEITAISALRLSSQILKLIINSQAPNASPPLTTIPAVVSL